MGSATQSRREIDRALVQKPSEKIQSEQRFKDGILPTAVNPEYPERPVSPAVTESAHGPPHREGARLFPHFTDFYEEYYLTSRSKDEAISELDRAQNTTSRVGSFFADGAFWLLMAILAEHSGELKKFIPWLAFCAVSIMAGLTLMFVSDRLDRSKQRLRKRQDTKNNDRPKV